MFDRYENIETAALILWCLGFTLAERLRPARSIDRRVHARLDVLALVVLLPLLGGSRIVMRAGLEPVRAAVAPALTALRELPSPAKVFLGLMLADFTLYWIHRAMHRFDVLWRTHEFHHSIENLYWFSGFRTSVLHGLLFTVPQVVIPFVLLDLSPIEAGIAFGIGAFFQVFMHANVDVPLGPLDWLVVTPQYHRVHHSCTKHRDQNLGISLAVWDRLFGTYMDPAAMPKDYGMGLGYQRPLGRLVVGV